MQDLLQSPTCAGIAEYPLAQAGAVEAARAVQHLCAECRNDLGQRRLPGFHQFAAEQVGVDHLRPEFGEVIAGSRLTAADAAGQTDLEQKRCPVP